MINDVSSILLSGELDDGVDLRAGTDLDGEDGANSKVLPRNIYSFLRGTVFHRG